MEQLALVFEGPILPLLSPEEIYAHADQALLQTLREDRRIERKSAKTDSRRLGDYHSMWANTKPDGGLIAVGVEKDGSISGCLRLSCSDLNEREKTAKDFCPDSRPESKRISVINADGLQDFVLLIRVPYREDKVVKTVAGKAYIRIGDEIKELSEDEIRELQIDKRELDLEREPITYLRWPNDFDAGLIDMFCQSVRAKWNLTGNQTDAETLQHRRLGKVVNGAFVPNTACTLVFAKDPLEKFPGCNIRFLRYDGEAEGTGQRYNVEKDIPIEGPIPRLIERAASVLESQLREFSGLGKDGKFYTVAEYPRSAWYEALVNACVHRSYGLRSRPVFVKMFDDRLVIESPGGFPPTVTPTNIYECHHPRNPNVMDALKYLDFVKCHNEGTRRMRDTMAEYKLPKPEFEQKHSDAGSYSVRVTLRNNIKFRKVLLDSALSRVLTETLLRSLDQRERMVLNFVAENGHINVSQCQRQLELARWHTAKRFLMTMVRKGLLKYHKTSEVERSRSFFTLPQAINISPER
jgi:ATP-dependent DNA helicase RecG